MKRCLFFLILFFSAPAIAQIRFQFLPELNGRSLEGLLDCNIINTSGRRNGFLQLTVSERKQGTVLVIRTKSFDLSPGMNAIPVVAARTASVQFFNNPIAVIINHRHNFPAGDYEYCFTMTYTGAGAPSEDCFDYHLLPFTQMNLIEPYNLDTICNKTPLFTWQPLIPAIGGTTYQLVLCQVNSGQNATEALNYNLPIINQSDIHVPELIYPPVAPQLADGNTYAWQVTAYNDHTILNRSEIWQFVAHCTQLPPPPLLAEDGYRDIEDLTKGDYYLAVGAIRFALINPYQPGALKYQIESLNKPVKTITGLPVIQLANGKNKITINVADTNSFTDGNSYLLTLWLPDGSVKYLRFIYKD